MWDQKDFPWLIMWDENKSRKLPPWNGKGHTRGMEFGNTAFGGPKKEVLKQGKVLTEMTATRISENNIWLLTGAGAYWHDRDWLYFNLPKNTDINIEDTTHN